MRSYTTTPQEWDGDSGCDHQWEPTAHRRSAGGERDYGCSDGGTGRAVPPDAVESAFCARCPSWRGELGSEPTIELYIDHLVQIFREVKRVLREDGTFWLNINDSYANDAKWGGVTGGKHVNGLHGNGSIGRGRKSTGLPPKSLMMIPARLAIALQEDGWVLRSEIVWVKKSPMPESVVDRATSAHEKIFMLAKSSNYFYDIDAVREPLSSNIGGRNRRTQYATASYDADAKVNAVRHGDKTLGTAVDNPSGRNMRNVWVLSSDPCPESHFAVFPREIPRRAILAGTSERGCCPDCNAPYRRITEKTLGTPDSFNGSSFNKGKTHDARVALAAVGQQERTLATKTVGWEPSCLCGASAEDVQPGDLDIIDTPTGERVADDPSLHTGRAGMNRPRGDNEGRRPITRYEQRKYAAQLRHAPHRNAMAAESGSAFAHYIRADRSGARPIPPDLLDAWLERGWLDKVEPPELHPLPPVPCTVLDPFAGSGTTLLVARQLGRHAIGIELQRDYIDIIKSRCNADQMSIFDAADEQREPQE